MKIKLYKKENSKMPSCLVLSDLEFCDNFRYQVMVNMASRDKLASTQNLPPIHNNISLKIAHPRTPEKQQKRDNDLAAKRWVYIHNLGKEKILVILPSDAEQNKNVRVMKFPVGKQIEGEIDNFGVLNRQCLDFGKLDIDRISRELPMALKGAVLNLPDDFSNQLKTALGNAIGIGEDSRSSYTSRLHLTEEDAWTRSREGDKPLKGEHTARSTKKKPGQFRS